MSSVELSDNFHSSEDEDLIVAHMESKSGLPQAFNVSVEGTVSVRTMESNTSVASVKIMGGVMKSVGDFYDSDSEDEAIMTSPDSLSQVTDVKAQRMEQKQQSNNSSRSSSFNTLKSFKTSPVNSSCDTLIQSNINGTSVSSPGLKGSKSTPNRMNFLQTVSNSNYQSVRKSSCDNYESNVECMYKEARFNPFDRDLPVDEEHFDDTNKLVIKPNSPVGRLKSDSNASSSWTDLSNPVSSNSDDVTFADLGLSEDHFSQPEGYFGMSSTEELEMAIETCKDFILDAPPHSDKQKNLVKKLVQLRMKLQEIKEGPEPVQEGIKVTVGHKFELHLSRGSKHYCEKCNAVIWGMLQQWYKCKECGFIAHEKCLNQITRTCAAVKVQEEPRYCLDIRPTLGLSAQNYRCAECRQSISYKSGFSEPRICDYSGNYFCELCHWNDTMLIPARVLHNWDFEPWKVCRASKQFLKIMETKAVIRIQDVNPLLFSVVEELNEVKKLREELLIMKKYILICSIAMASKLLLMLKKRQHFVESSDIYCMRDLIDVQSDMILPELALVHSSWAQHIKTDCELCKAKGFICELCDVDEILFPFDNIAVVCSECSCVLHRHCFAKRAGICPRCERRNKRKEAIADG